MCAPDGDTYVAHMKRYLPRSTVAAALLAGALFASATGGAVAGSMITGKQIKNGSVTGKDVKDKSVAAADLAADARVPGPAGVTGPPGTRRRQHAPARRQVVCASGPQHAGAGGGQLPGRSEGHGRGGMVVRLGGAGEVRHH